MTQEQKAEHDYDRAKDEAAERHGDDLSMILRTEYEAHWFMHRNEPLLARVQYQKIVDRLAYAHEYSRWSASRMPEGSHERGYLSEYQRLRAENKRLREALKECEAEIDANIDRETPTGVHPKWDSDNAYLKANNPARLALQEADNDTQ